MKILIDLTSLADNFSGIERYAACISYEMILESQDKYILLFKGSVHPIFEEFRNNNRIELVVLSACKKLLFNQIRLPKEIYKFKADWYLFLAFPVPVLLFKKNMISTIHDICCWDCPETMTRMSKWYFKISHRVALKKCRNIITISEFSKKRIKDRLNYPDNKILLIYCGISDSFHTQNYGASEIKRIKDKYKLPSNYILSLSTLEPRKNLKLLVDAYSELYNNNNIDYELVLAGRKGWKMDNFLNGYSKTIVSHIHFTGFIDDEDLPLVYSLADLFVFPSKYEGFGIPPLESMACGTPVISSDSSSMPEVLGDAAVYFKSEDKESLKVKIEEFLRNPINTCSICKGKERAKEFSWIEQANKLLTLLSDEIENKKVR